jgi:peptidyl-prolyl cis-trans isomerase SurA
MYSDKRNSNPMKKFILIPIIVLASFVSTFGQNDILLEIDNEKVELEEFKRIYFKNNKDSALTLASLEEYLELFTNFKLKVHEAKALELDKKSKFIKELGTYREQLVKPYLTDSSTDERLVREAYDRMKHIVRASHILFKSNPKDTPKDTLATYNKAMKVLEELRNGADFATLAKKYSQDPSVKYNEGDLGYFSAFKMVYKFENAAFNTKAGEVSDLVRTRFGYHIIKVTDKKEAPGTVEAAHIMVRLPENAPAEEATKAEEKINKIYKELQDGLDFAKAAEKYSEDPQTAKKGGMLPKFTPGRMLPNFEEEIFKLENGSYSKPFRTKVGWHVVKKYGNEPIASLDQERSEIKRKLSKTARAQLSRKKVIEKLKKEYNFTTNEEALTKFYSAINKENLLKNAWNIEGELDLDVVVAEFKDQKIALKELSQWIQQRLRQPKTDADAFLKSSTAALFEDRIIKYEKAHLEDKYDDFAWLMKEYHDGILLFNITDSIVWKKAVKDTTGLQTYFENNRDKYQYPERMKADIIDVNPLTNKRKTAKIIKKAYGEKKLEELQNMLREYYNDTTLTVIVDSGNFEKGVNRYVGMTDWKTGLHFAEQNKNTGTFVYNHEVLPARHKELNEIRGMATADYQNYLEAKWIDQLKEKYEIKVHKELLKKLLE